MIILQWNRLGAGHVPVFLAIIFTFTLGITYILSVYRGDVDPVFPYISTSGDLRPESCLFSMLLNVCTFFTMLVILLRYLLIVELNRSTDLTLKFFNRIVFYLGLAGAFGMFFVANFQETAVIQIHLFGAILSFGFGCLYMLGQTWISYRMHPLFAGQRIAHIRLGLAIASSLCFIIALGLGIEAANIFHRAYPELPTPRPWNRKLTPMPGYTLHCISAMAEWACAIFNMLFLLSFSRDFEKIRVQLSVQPLVLHLDHSPFWTSINDLSTSP